MRNKRKVLFTLLFLLFFSIGIGYASLRTELTQTGVVNIIGNNWNIYFNNIIPTGDSNITPTTNPTISNRKTISYSLTLTSPQDKYDFYVYITNNGTLPAMLNNYSLDGLSTEDASNIAYTITYADGSSISQYDSLPVNESRLLKVHTEFIGSTPQATNLNLSLTLNYIRATGSATNPSISAFTIYTNLPTSIGSAFTSISTPYDNPNTLINNYAHDFLLKHTISGNVISTSSIGYKYASNMYYLQGAVNESALEIPNQTVYNNNKTILDNTLGTCTDNTTYYECTSGNLTIRVDNNGYVNITDTVATCTINSNGTSGCS